MILLLLQIGTEREQIVCCYAGTARDEPCTYEYDAGKTAHKRGRAEEE